ncbi:MAG: hypothetical protein PHR35_11930 [Kiritimatiellae bacterium]|nr:hypothetical protein [Kiritimatiellia bacterium]
MIAGLILALLLLAALIAVLVPPGAWGAAVRQWRRLPRQQVIAMLIAMTAMTWCGADKSVASRRLAQFVTALADGNLAGPTNVIASAVAAVAVQAVLNESDAMYNTSSQAVDWCYGEIPLLEDAITNTAIAWIQGESPAPLDQENPVVRADLMQSIAHTNGIHDVYVAFSQTPASAPTIEWEACCDSNGVYYSFSNVSNSFPVLFGIETPSGVSSCYLYAVSVPAALAGMELIPEREITFGGGSSNAPLSVLGSLSINDKLGITGVREIAPGIAGTFEGGALVGVQDL